MNTHLFKNSSLQKIISADCIKSRLIYVAYFILGLFFLGSSLLTLLRTATLLATQTSVPTVTFPILFVYIFIQFLLGYGLLFCRRWILVLLSIHVAYSLLLILLLLPYFNLSHLMMRSSITAIPFIILLLFTLYSRGYCTGKIVSHFAIIAYSIALAVVVIINIIFGGSL
jgi:hypothetical protein